VTTFVCAGRHVYAFADEASAMDAALDLARTHQRVGVDTNEDGATRAARRALPGMVCCPRALHVECVECYPLTSTTALVRPCNGSSSRSPEDRTLRSTTPRATPLAPTTS
jgi:hypothetical protein